MDRKTINSFIRARGGKQIHHDRESTAYVCKMSEAEFIDFRSRIPFNTLWYTGTPDNIQTFRVWFSELRD